MNIPGTWSNRMKNGEAQEVPEQEQELLRQFQINMYYETFLKYSYV
jgi:hypothetical protein